MQCKLYIVVCDFICYKVTLFLTIATLYLAVVTVTRSWAFISHYVSFLLFETLSQDFYFFTLRQKWDFIHMDVVFGCPHTFGCTFSTFSSVSGLIWAFLYNNIWTVPLGFIMICITLNAWMQKQHYLQLLNSCRRSALDTSCMQDKLVKSGWINITWCIW